MDWFVKRFLQSALVWLGLGVSAGVAMTVQTMRTFFAALTGLGTTVVLSMIAALLGSGGFEGGFALLGVSIYMMIAVTLGGMAAAKIQNTPNAISAFAALQLFAGFPETGWLVPQAPSWYRLIILVLVIPCAALGGKLGGAPVTSATSWRNDLSGN